MIEEPITKELSSQNWQINIKCLASKNDYFFFFFN